VAAADIDVAYGGHRMSWQAVSDRGRAWVVAQRDLPSLAPEGVECLIQFGDSVIERALRAGLSVMCGDAEVSLC
jgi:hypothetical protein